jgi:hypothetical protein
MCVKRTAPQNVNKNENRNPGGRWLKGAASPNPAGRPMAARQRISEKLLADLAVVWEEHGSGVLQRLAVTEPAKLAQIAYGLLPRDVSISLVFHLGLPWRVDRMRHIFVSIGLTLVF